MRYPSTEPVVITCALTGGIHGKEANPNLPEQPDEIVAQGVAAAAAGAAILHVHARNPDGSNTMSPEIYGELHERLKAETDAVIQLTTGGSPTLPVQERLNTVLLSLLGLRERSGRAVAVIHAADVPALSGRPAAVRERLAVFPPGGRIIAIQPWVSTRRRR